MRPWHLPRYSVIFDCAHVVELVLLCTQTGFDISQTFPVGQLSEGHTEELIQTGKALYPVVAMVSFYASPKGVHGKMIHKDRKSTRLNSSHIPLSRMPSSA